MRVAAILVAAGAGRRFGGETPKQFQSVAGKPVIRWAAEALLPHVCALLPVGDPALIDPALAGLDVLPAVPGGDTRQESVSAGLRGLVGQAPELVMVHDAARPFLPPETVPALLAALRSHDGAIPGLAVTDTSLPPSLGVMKPNPLSGLYHFTVPSISTAVLKSICGRAERAGRGLLSLRWEEDDVLAVLSSTDRTCSTWRPFWPCPTRTCICMPGPTAVRPAACRALAWRKTSPVPSASSTKPNPFSELNHFTVARSSGEDTGVPNPGKVGGDGVLP